MVPASIAVRGRLCNRKIRNPFQRRSNPMAGDKVTLSFEIQSDAEAFLEEMAAKYEMPDRDKALRALLDYAIQDGDQDEIFGEIRCLRCDD
jgi:hypothetical protein